MLNIDSHVPFTNATCLDDTKTRYDDAHLHHEHSIVAADEAFAMND